MSLKLTFSAIALSGAVDQNTGNLSVFEVIDEVRVGQVPAHLPSLVITLAFLKTIAEGLEERIFIHLLTPDGKQNMIGSGDMKVPAEQKRVKAMFRFGGFPVAQFGSHRIVVSWMGKSGQKEGEAIFDFEVVQVTPPAQGPRLTPVPGGGGAGGGEGVSH